MENNFEIYKITNLLSGKSYIGQTRCGYQARWKTHNLTAIRGSSLVIHRALRKYGSSNFKIELIANALSLSLLNALEIFLIRQYNTFKSGYNMNSGGKVGTEISEEVREKLRASKIGNKHCVGRVYSKDTLIKMSLGSKGHKRCLGKKHSTETLKKMSKAQMGNTNSKTSGYVPTLEAREKMSVSSKGVSNPMSRGIITTPFGNFNTTKEAAELIKCDRSTVGNRCNSNSPRWKAWFFELEKH